MVKEIVGGVATSTSRKTYDWMMDRTVYTSNSNSDLSFRTFLLHIQIA